MTEYEKIVEEAARQIYDQVLIIVTEVLKPYEKVDQMPYEQLPPSGKAQWEDRARQILSTEVGTHRVAVVNEGAIPPNRYSRQQDMILANWRKVVIE